MEVEESSNNHILIHESSALGLAQEKSEGEKRPDVGLSEIKDFTSMAANLQRDNNCNVNFFTLASGPRLLSSI